MAKPILFLVGPLLVLGLLWAGGALCPWEMPGPFFISKTVERLQPTKESTPLLEDDRLSEKHPRWDETRIHPEAVGPPGNRWALNLSSCVTSLDVLPLRSDDPMSWKEIHPSATRAAKALASTGLPLLPSLNLVAAHAKNFDDRLYARLDEAVALSADGFSPDAAALIRSLAEGVTESSPARPWLLAALAVGGFLPDEERSKLPAQAMHLEQSFLMDEGRSKVVGFYQSSEALKRSFRFLRFLSQAWFERTDMVDALASEFRKDPKLLKAYKALLSHAEGLTASFEGLSLLPIIEDREATKDLARIWKDVGFPSSRRQHCHFLPPSGSPESRLLRRIDPEGLPPDIRFMTRFVQAIRSGTLDLSPTRNSGWYDHQLHALEAMLFPERNPEAPWLLLSRRYKERMLQAFRVLVTKTRETHLRQLSRSEKLASPPPKRVLQPHLRVEPNPSWFLRMARSYGFVRLFLKSRNSSSTLEKLPLFDELRKQQDFFYGLHLISCEDLGAPHALLEDEVPQKEACQRAAMNWLKTWKQDPALSQDLRACVPLQINWERKETLDWLVLGIRGIRLKVRWARLPRWRPVGQSDAPFRPIPKSKATTYLLLVEEFAEARHPSLAPMTRRAFQELCDRHRDEEAIVKAMAESK